MLELDPAIALKILNYLRLGSYVETAAAAAGISKSTIYRWLRRGAEGEEPFHSFSLEVDRAMAEGELRQIARIDKAAEDDWHAAAWIAERRNPKRWGPHQYTEVTEGDGSPSSCQEMSDDELTAAIERLSGPSEERGAVDGAPGEGEA